MTSSDREVSLPHSELRERALTWLRGRRSNDGETEDIINGLLEQLEAVRGPLEQIAKLHDVDCDQAPHIARRTLERMGAYPANSPVECDGTRYCVAETHIHGCFAERIPGQAQSPAKSPNEVVDHSDYYREYME